MDPSDADAAPPSSMAKQVTEKPADARAVS
jgi:hypothetical protein